MSPQEEVKSKTVKSAMKWWHVPLILIGIIFIIPILFIALICWVWRLIWGTWLGLRVKSQWYPQGKRMLFVYSNSPNWKEYIETNILPKIASQATVLNWSERSQWKDKSLEIQVFQHWASVKKYFWRGKTKWDGAEFNPIAITFIPWWKRRVFRFWQPFKDFKHGKEQSLKKLEVELFQVLKITS